MWTHLRISRGHPRACGDQVPREEAVTGGVGSSPCVRGPGHQSDFSRQRSAVIPVRAGTRRRFRSGCRTACCHPRACGDQASLALAAETPSSSPRFVSKRPECPRAPTRGFAYSATALALASISSSVAPKTSDSGTPADLATLRRASSSSALALKPSSLFSHSRRSPWPSRARSCLTLGARRRPWPCRSSTSPGAPTCGPWPSSRSPRPRAPPADPRARSRSPCSAPLHRHAAPVLQGRAAPRMVSPVSPGTKKAACPCGPTA